jgi:hypothetical protein
MISLPEEQEDRPVERVVEVCQGPDCFGSGGGAVLLEIEDLVTKRPNGNNGAGADTMFTSLAGGCRNFCTMGPNVHIGGIHYTKVDSIEECRKIAREVGMVASNDRSVTPPLATAAVMQRRKDRIRWQELRMEARKLKRKPRNTEAAPASNFNK